MNQKLLVILIYLLVVTALVGSVKLIHTYITRNQATHEVKVADCSDPPVSPSAGE